MKRKKTGECSGELNILIIEKLGLINIELLRSEKDKRYVRNQRRKGERQTCRKTDGRTVLELGAVRALIRCCAGDFSISHLQLLSR